MNTKTAQRIKEFLLQEGIYATRIGKEVLSMTGLLTDFEKQINISDIDYVCVMFRTRQDHLTMGAFIKPEQLEDYLDELDEKGYVYRMHLYGSEINAINGKSFGWFRKKYKRYDPEFADYVYAARIPKAEKIPMTEPGYLERNRRERMKEMVIPANFKISGTQADDVVV